MAKYPQLNPTLWRTCRVLSGRKRLELLRHLHDTPGQNVTELAHQTGIGISDASQELRRIQSRGLLAADRQGARLVYRLQADPQVPSAAPLLAALKHALGHLPAEQDATMAPIATGLAHPRRVAIVKALQSSALAFADLRRATRILSAPLGRHLDVLETSGWIRRNKRQIALVVPDHPLALALSRLV